MFHELFADPKDVTDTFLYGFENINQVCTDQN